ncbi:hypothetical protein G4B88_012520, partial [Cannabis sativa]
MESFWKRAKGLAEEAAKTSQSLTTSAKISDLVSETAKRSRELAAEASKRADLIKTAALKQADQIKSFSSDIIVNPPTLSSLSITSSFPSSSSSSTGEVSQSDLLKFGINEDLTDFVKGLTSTTFQSFTIQDEAEGSDSETSTTASNIRKDLTEWQEKHANLVLTSVKQMSRLRYELCPRIMKERRFWKIYFTLVSSYVAPYEKQYMEEVKLKEAEQKKDDETKQASVVGGNDKEKGMEKNLSSKTSKSSSAEQDLDTFLLGDLEDSDGGLDDGEESFDDDFDKIDNSDVEDDKEPKNDYSDLERRTNGERPSRWERRLFSVEDDALLTAFLGLKDSGTWGTMGKSTGSSPRPMTADGGLFVDPRMGVMVMGGDNGDGDCDGVASGIWVLT